MIHDRCCATDFNSPEYKESLNSVHPPMVTAVSSGAPGNGMEGPKKESKGFTPEQEAKIIDNI